MVAAKVVKMHCYKFSESQPYESNMGGLVYFAQGGFGEEEKSPAGNCFPVKVILIFLFFRGNGNLDFPRY